MGVAIGPSRCSDNWRPRPVRRRTRFRAVVRLPFDLPEILPNRRLDYIEGEQEHICGPLPTSRCRPKRIEVRYALQVAYDRLSIDGHRDA
jgi:hypothetical protein